MKTATKKKPKTADLASVVRLIKDRLRKLDMNAAELVRRLDGDPGNTVVNRFLNCKQNIRSEHLLKILDALDWEGSIRWKENTANEKD